MQQKIVNSIALLICSFLRISATLPNDVPLNIQNENFPQYPNCGIVKNADKGRISKGTEVQKHEFPWMVYLGMGCGGTLINSRWVLTAAHCVEDGSYPNVYLGAHICKTHGFLWWIWSECDSSTEQVTTKVILHEDYNGRENNYHHDIALLQLKDPVTFSDKVQPICLPYNNEALDEKITDKDSIVSGWGSTEFDNHSEHLLKTSVRIWEGNKCQAFDKFIDYDGQLILNKDIQLCAGGDGADTCKGDSGGPMFMRLASSENDKNMPYYQMGITSIGHPTCGKENYPGVYTKVSAYLTWIRETVLKNE